MVIVQKRILPRKALQGNAQVNFADNISVLQLIDISPLGLSVFSRNLTPAIGEECLLTFLVPDQGGGREVVITAEVSHCRFHPDTDGFRIGLRFKTIHSDGAVLIDHYVNHS